MAHHCKDAHTLRTVLLALWFTRVGQAFAGTDTNIEAQLQALQQQNETLQKQLREQQEVIDSLRRDVAGIRQSNVRLDTATGSGQTDALGEGSTASLSSNFGKVHLSGEGGAGLFATGSDGFAPNWEFRLDEARLFVDAQAWNNIYAYFELNLATHENQNISLGEAYVDAEDVSQLWGRPGQLNVRIGRMYIPFGEEYLRRNAIDNPLISRSLSDLWGYDEGVEVYGAAGKFSYVAAVQNGGVHQSRDFDPDKSLAGRLSYDPNQHLHFSISGMRTGDLDAKGDKMSAMWFGGGFFVPLGTSKDFHANLAEIDAEWRCSHGYVKTRGGYVRYNDNEDSGRDIYYYSIEGVHDLTDKFYAAARFSQIFALGGGYPILGNANAAQYFPGPVTEQIWRLSLGLGYRWNRNFILKSEYSLERGKEVSGENRDHEDLFATEAVFGF
jgi:hypothetical protein